MSKYSIAIETAAQRWEYPNTPLGRLRAWFRERRLLYPPLTPYAIDRTNMPMRRIRP